MLNKGLIKNIYEEQALYISHNAYLTDNVNVEKTENIEFMNCNIQVIFQKYTIFVEWNIYIIILPVTAS